MESHFQNSILQMPLGFASLNTYRSMEFLTQHLDRQYELKPEVSNRCVAFIGALKYVFIRSIMF